MRQLFPAIVIASTVFMLQSCAGTPDRNAVCLRIANENLRIAEETLDDKDQEKYYLQALSNFYKYICVSDNSKAGASVNFEIGPDDDESVIEAKIKARKCIGILKDRFGRNCRFQDAPLQ